MVSETIPIEPTESANLFALEVPQTETSEAGREVIRIGDVDLAKRTWEQQGCNGLGYGATSGLAAVANCLRMLGLDITEQEAVQYAADHGLCNIGATTRTSGGTAASDQLSFLKAFGVPVQLKVMEKLEQIVEAVLGGQGVLVDVNAGVLWHEEAEGAGGDQAYRDHYQNGAANYVIQVVGIANDRQTNELIGFYVNDTGIADGAGRFVSAQVMQAAAIGGPEQPVLGTIITTSLAHKTAGS
jgi:hypothetical protein